MKIRYPSRDDLRWVKGKPGTLEPGMFIKEYFAWYVKRKTIISLVGDCNDKACECGCDWCDKTSITHYMPVDAIEVEDEND